MCKSRKKVLDAAKVGGMEIPAAKHQHWSTPGQQVETTGEVFTAAGAKLLFHLCQLLKGLHCLVSDQDDQSGGSMEGLVHKSCYNVCSTKPLW